MDRDALPILVTSHDGEILRMERYSGNAWTEWRKKPVRRPSSRHRAELVRMPIASRPPCACQGLRMASVRRAFVWATFARYSNIAVNLVTTIIVARTVSPAAY